MDQRTSGSDIPIGTTRASELNEPGRGTKETVKEKAREIGQRAAERAQSAVGEQKERATSELGAIAFALRDASQRLEGENMMSGRFIRSAAERLDNFSRRLESRDLDGILLETRQWARRSPAAFMGAAIAIGFLASRFLKASEQSRGFSSWEDDFENDYDPYTSGVEEYPRNEPRATGGTDYPSGTGYSTGTGPGFTPGSGTGGSFGGGTTGSGGGANGRS